MVLSIRNCSFILSFILFSLPGSMYAQSGGYSLKFQNSSVYAGIEVGSKGVKMSILEIGKNAQRSGAFNVLKDTSINTDFISFNNATFEATVTGMCKLYASAVNDYNVPTERIYTVVSSGVKGQAEKENKVNWINNLIDSVKGKLHEPDRLIEVVDVKQEARLSHLGIVPESRRYTTFLIDIGSGNTKGGYFPDGNTQNLKLFQLNWGTKSTTNATEKRTEDDKTIDNFNKQLQRVLAGPVNAEVVYAVNESGAYNASDNVAFSGGIAWSVATLLYPELNENTVVPVTYDEVVKFSEKLFSNPDAFSETAIGNSISSDNVSKQLIVGEVKRVNKVFDQRALLAGTGLLLKIMRQFEGVYERKLFYLVKNGQVGWISAYVDQHSSNADKAIAH